MNNRLQKKCVVAATGFHLLLLAVLLFGSAFFTSNDSQRDLQMVEVFDINKLIDKPFVGGGEPDATPPPPAPPTPTPPTPKPAQPVQSQPTPPKAEEIERPQPPETRQDNPKPAADSLEVAKPKTHKPQINTTVVKASPGKQKQKQKTQPNTTSDSNARETAEAFNNTIISLKKNFSPGTKVGIPGPGGEAYAGYENVLQTIYQRNYDLELDGADVGESGSGVEVSVTISRDGKVRTSRLTKPSGNASLNKLVQRVLNRVTFVAPFPSQSKDQERTFTIVFDLKPKKALG